MRINARLRKVVAFVLASAVALALCGCGSLEAGATGIKFTAGKMLHLQQVLERYDADGKPVPQYLELWLAKGLGRSEELDSSGKILDVSLDTGKSHIAFNVSSHEASKTDTSGIFTVSFTGMKKAYPSVTQTSEGTYAGRPCELYMLSNGNPDEWVKIYVDKATGCVLLCDAPLFRLRTAKLEELPMDDSMFTEPHDLVYKEGAGK